MILMRRAWLGISLLSIACEPQYTSGQWSCDPAEGAIACPSGFVCAFDGRCYAPGDVPTPADAAIPDGTPIDATPPLPTFARKIGGTLRDEPFTLALDPSGAMIVAGIVSSDVDFGGGNVRYQGGYTDTFVAKYSVDNSHVWSSTIGGTGEEYLYGLGVDQVSGKTYVGGMFDSPSLTLPTGAITNSTATGRDGFLVAFSPGGTVLWGKQVGDSVSTITVAGDGDLLVAGGFSGTFDFGTGPITSSAASEGFIARLAPLDGRARWVRTFTAGPSAITIDAAGDLVVVGGLGASADFGGGQRLGPARVNSFLAKFRGASGAHVWSIALGQISADTSLSRVVAGEQDELHVAGNFTNNVDFGGGELMSRGAEDGVILRFEGSSGLYVSGQRVGGTGMDRIRSMDVHGDALYVTGYFSNIVDFGGGPITSAGADDAFLLHLSAATGNYVSARRFGNSGNDRAFAVAALPSNVVIAGGFELGADRHRSGRTVPDRGFSVGERGAGSLGSGERRQPRFSTGVIWAELHPFEFTVDFGGISLTSAGEDVFLVRLSP